VLGEKPAELIGQEAMKSLVKKVATFVTSYAEEFIIAAEDKTGRMKDGCQCKLVQRVLQFLQIFQLILLNIIDQLRTHDLNLSDLMLSKPLSYHFENEYRETRIS